MNSIFDTFTNAILGEWKGSGKAEYPTISSIIYKEEITFSVNNFDPVIYFEEKSWITSEGSRKSEPIFWESGFIKLYENGLVTLSCSQKTGRVEYYEGNINIMGDKIGAEFILKFTNDVKLRQVIRKIESQQEIINLCLNMEYGECKSMHNHLVSKLTKS